MPRHAPLPARARLGMLLLAAIVATACGSPEASHAPSLAAPSVAPSVAPSQNAPGGPLAEALVKALNADPLVLHLEQVATATTSFGSPGPTVEVRLSADLDGDDFSMTLTATSDGTGVDQEIVVVGDAAYARPVGGTWKKGPRTSIKTSIANLITAIRLVDDPADLRDAGSETIDGQELRHLTASGTIPYVPAAGGTGKYDVFDIYVLDDGTPVLARTAFSATGPNGETVSGTTQFMFSNVGGPIDIVAPSVAP